MTKPEIPVATIIDEKHDRVVIEHCKDFTTDITRNRDSVVKLTDCDDTIIRMVDCVNTDIFLQNCKNILIHTSSGNIRLGELEGLVKQKGNCYGNL